MFLRSVFCVFAATAPAISLAQEQGNGIAFRFGLGPSFQPGYFGDEDMEPGVGAAFTLERFRLGGLSLGGDDSFGLGFGGSLRVIGGRSADDFAELSGLADIDPALEIGGGLEFTAPGYEVFAKVRYGVIGHESFVAELGGDLVFRPSDQLSIKVGPRMLLGDDTYAQTYFGVSPTEADASDFTAFDASGGLVSTGAEAEATYAINDDWEVVSSLQYDVLREDAAASPLTRSNDMLSGRIVLTRRITLGF